MRCYKAQRIAGFLIVTMCPVLALAQQPEQKDDIEAVRAVPAARLFPPARRRGAPTRSPIQLSKLALAKIDQDGDETKLIVLVEQFRTKERQVTVMRMRSEKRTRTVTVTRDGKDVEVEQNYTVNVPFQETVNAAVPVAAGKKPWVIALDKAKFFRLDATPVSTDEAKKLLEKMRPIFLERDPNVKLEPASDLIQQAITPDTLIVITDGKEQRVPIPPPALLQD